jgi:phospholipase/lecithinase/hemolysin
MRITNFLGLTALAVLLSACGAGSSTAPQFASVISFGDSLSDAGAYNAGGITQVGGGKFTTNPGPVWIETVAKSYGVTITPNKVGGFGVAPVTCPKPSCTAYGQGGSRVTSQPGIGNSDASLGLNSGAQTVPMATQIADHLAQHGGAFNGNDLIFVWGGNNDIFVWFGLTGSTIPGTTTVVTPTIATAQVQKAAGELVTLISDKIIAKGGQYVAVLNLGDSSKTPFGAFGLPDDATRGYLSSLVDAFNKTMADGIKAKGLNVLVIDANAAAKDELANPAKYGFTNTTLPACDSGKITNITGGNVTSGSSLFCSANTLVAAGADTTFLFADGVHPTTVGHKAISDLVKAELQKKGWL